jgi:hypothetical protein
MSALQSLRGRSGRTAKFLCGEREFARQSLKSSEPTTRKAHTKELARNLATKHVAQNSFLSHGGKRIADEVCLEKHQGRHIDRFELH